MSRDFIFISEARPECCQTKGVFGFYVLRRYSYEFDKIKNVPGTLYYNIFKV